MLRKLTFGISVFLTLFFFSFYFFVVKTRPQEKTLGIKQEFEFKSIAGFNSVYNFDYIIADPNRVFLYLNTEKLSGSEIREKYSCNYLVNGGFYDSDFKRIGLLISEGEEVSSWQRNRLFNAIFSINRFDTARITREPPKDSLRIALQSGPMVFENGTKVSIKSSAVFERRVVLGVTGENKPIFLVFWSQDNFLKGPSLEEIPYLIEEINKNFNLNIADALNLDGGTASFFYTNRLRLGEVSLVGSFFCVVR